MNVTFHTQEALRARHESFMIKKNFPLLDYFSCKAKWMKGKSVPPNIIIIKERLALRTAQSIIHQLHRHAEINYYC